jgi:AraC-like DNA-binding protein
LIAGQSLAGRIHRSAHARATRGRVRVIGVEAGRGGDAADTGVDDRKPSVSRSDQVLFPTGDRMALRAREQLESRRIDEDTRIGRVARCLATSPCTLQRRLAAEGVSYQRVLDDWRKDAARRHLAASALSIGEVAYLLGFFEPAPFHRAFKRWFGVKTQTFRQEQHQRSSTADR